LAVAISRILIFLCRKAFKSIHHFHHKGKTIMNQTVTGPQDGKTPWYSGLSRYHWFVFIVCCLGWGLDCFDQQVFNIMRNPALAQLMGLDATHATVTKMGAYATSIMLLGWGFGGILFGIMADKYGRARTMIITIFVYAIFTGLSGLATCWWDFFLYRFLCGMGVGGQFAAGVTLLAETMPDKARPKALGYLQMTAALCNVLAATLAMVCGILEGLGFFGDFPVWRFLFLVGFAPALLAFAVMRHLQEPQPWKDAIAAGGVKKAGSVTDLFSHPRWRYNVIIGMCLATCGVIGLWGIGFFSVDLTRTTFRIAKNQEARDWNEIEIKDFELVRMLAINPKEFLPIAEEKKLSPLNFIGVTPKTNDAGAIYMSFLEDSNLDADTVLEKAKTAEERERWRTVLAQEREPHNVESVLTLFDTLSENQLKRVQWQSAKNLLQKELDQRRRVLEAIPGTASQQEIDKAVFGVLADSILARSKSIGSYVTIWAGITSILFNAGAFIGTWVIVVIAQAWGRRMAFTVFFAASFFMTILVFMTMGSGTLMHPEYEVLVMTPLLGFCILSIFGGYAVYFPELFPTRLRGTAISFCYNIARFVAATGPVGLGVLTAYVFYNTDEPLRWAGAAMAITFVLGIIFTWMGPETKGQPLPEE
jgi:MFS family permease